MVVNANSDALSRMYDDYNCGSSPHVAYDGGIEVFHGTPAGATSYIHSLNECCVTGVETVSISVSPAWVSATELEISVSIDFDPPEYCCLARGDVNHDGIGVADISDLIALVEFMFQNGSPPPCEFPPGSGYYPEADINGAGSGPDISDLVDLVSYMFQGCTGCLEPCPGQ